MKIKKILLFSVAGIEILLIIFSAVLAFFGKADIGLYILVMSYYIGSQFK